MNSYKIKTICKSFLLLNLLIFIGTSCSQDEKEIRKTAESYLTAFVNYRLDEAKKFGDESAIEFLDEMQQIYNTCTPEEREQNMQRLQNIEVNISSIEVKNSTAKVKYEFTKEGKTLQADILSLIKKDDTWKVQEFM